MLNHSTQRILEIKEVENNVKNLLSTVNGFSQSCNNFSGELKLKWGFDGATGQSEYKQKYHKQIEALLISFHFKKKFDSPIHTTRVDVYLKKGNFFGYFGKIDFL